MINFICAQKIETFNGKQFEDFDYSFHIPKYINMKLYDDKFSKTISDIYLGSLISSYFEFKINTPVADTELLIDTNFFISLINLNTFESYLTCNKLYEVCNRLGFKFTILYSTVDEIKNLLNSKIYDFANKEIGIVKEADIFGAVVRRELDKTHLERIKDNIDSNLLKYKIDIITEEKIKDIVDSAKESDVFYRFVEIRQNDHSALNDAIAYYYVNSRRGKNITEFADSKCWFLNNSYSKDYHISKGYNLHDRYKICANELLSLLWLSNPNQELIDIRILTKGGLATYISKYKQYKIPSISTIEQIHKRAKNSLSIGELTEKDVYSISIRMSEGQLTNGDAKKLAEMPDEKFIESIKKYSIDNNKTLDVFNEQDVVIKKLNKLLENLQQQYDKIESKFEESEKIKNQNDYIAKRNIEITNKYNKTASGYIFFVFVLIILWLVNYMKFNFINNLFSGIIALVLFILTLLIRFIDHKSVLTALKFTFSSNYRSLLIEEYKKTFIDEYNKKQ